ncbi:MAG: FIG00501464: hypothetical protein, partial [uncultured Solirubrobacteraceae bacterium]
GQGRGARSTATAGQAAHGCTPRTRAAPGTLAHGTRARRRRLHRRRLRDRGTASARPALGQQDRQRVRRLRRNELRLVRRRARRQRRHARGDDARRQPAGTDAVPRHRPGPAPAPELRRVRHQGRSAAAARGVPGARAGRPRGPAVGDGPRHRAGRGPPERHVQRQGDRALHAQGALRSRPLRRLPDARQGALPPGDRLGHLRADRPRQPGLGRRSHLHRRGRLDGAADGLHAGEGARARARRRRPGLDDEPRHRRGSRREARRGHQPAGPLRQPVRRTATDPAGLAHAPRQRHGLPADRLPGVQAARLPAPARDGQAVGGALPGRRHRADRTRARRRADVPDLDDELRLADGHRPPRLRVREAQARHGLRRVQGDLRPARHRDLPDARAQGHHAFRRREGAHARVAQDPRADDGSAAAPVLRGGRL